MWALNYYIIELSWVPKQLPVEFQTVETRCGRESHIRPRGPSESPDGVRTPTSGEQERHNVTVITVGSKYEVYVRCPAPSHMQTLNIPFEPCNKLRGIYFVKEVLASFITASVIIASVCIQHIYVYFCMNQKMTMQHILIWCMCQQSSSRIQNEPGYRKRQFLSITTRHQRKGQRKMMELKEVKRKKKNKNKLATKKEEGERNRPTRKEQKKRRKEKREKEKKENCK